MDSIYRVEADSKPCFDLESLICRCCFSTNKKLFSIAPLNAFFLDVVHIDITDDGLPPWLCNECYALLIKAVRFKQKVHRAHNLWFDYINRCAPFPMDAQDVELQKYSLPLLKETETLSISSDICQVPPESDCQVYYHKTTPTDLELTVPLPIQEDGERSPFEEDEVKMESTISDYEDNMTLDAFRSVTKPADDLAALLDDPDFDIKEEPVETKKKKKQKKGQSKEKRKKKKIDTDDEQESGTSKSVRASSVAVDEEKVELITLDPADHMRQVKAEAESETLKFPFHCALCYRGFNFQYKLDNHMKKHSPSRGPFTCSHCHMHFPSSFSQRVHMYTHTRRYRCRLCDKVVRDPATVMQHVRSQHEGISDVFTCEICGKISTNSKTHRGHLRNSHGGARPTCALCARSFVNLASLREHMQIHEGVKNYACAVCGKQFRTRTQVKFHQLAHTNLRQFYCVECDVRFKSAQSLKQHLEKSLKHVDKNTYKSRAATRVAATARVGCPSCGRSLSSARALRRHARVHQQPPAPPAPPRHRCVHCQRAFASKSVLTNHVRTHTGEKPFACALCARRFAQRTAMLTHVKLVHLVKGNNAGIQVGVPAGASSPTPVATVVPAPAVKQEAGLPWRGEGEVYFTVSAGP